ncbi:molybdenum cofactor guanylyltransferase [Agromyces aerolatus]|uniref:molybdenum cofactor guanylyltransferase n=1 Tax=Agromyces sp. LY-1074 TaxID=3074080 RepID=UPI00286652B4|nr:MULTISPECIES: NTP transferase domain-containing protein [unclassified Agromyces]MDR5698786.1 NTP transferase domain-containing protein [Agromyces sp. LY-1074]MDR5705436.1 NTP transferase domain-containing protein [Agromyces sp. LY-1358]
MTIDCGAILLAGGRGSRMSGARKPLLEVGGRSLLEHAHRAASWCDPVTVVGDVRDARLNGVEWVREDPPFGGPAAAVAAALSSWAGRGDSPAWTLVLACDLPGAGPAVARLRRAAQDAALETDGVCLADPSGRTQWLTGLYRTSVLTARAAALPDAARDASIRSLLDGLAIEVVPAPAAETADIDTWEDLETARAGTTGAGPTSAGPTTEEP